MILLQISDIQTAMSHLLVRNSFDDFYLESAEILTFASLSIRGRRNQSWYDTEEADAVGSEWIFWKEIKPVACFYIKGNKTPTLLKLSLQAGDDIAESLLKDCGVWGKYLEQRPKLALQFRYEQGGLSVVSGISYQEFVLDKEIEFAWDDAVRQYFRHLGIALF